MLQLEPQDLAYARQALCIWAVLPDPYFDLKESLET